MNKLKRGYAREETVVFTSFARLHLDFVIRNRAPATAAPVARINDFFIFMQHKTKNLSIISPCSYFLNPLVVEITVEK